MNSLSDKILRLCRGKGSPQEMDTIFYEVQGATLETLAVVSPEDLARGFLKLKNEPEHLCRWARMILMGPFLDLSEEFDTTAEGEQLLEALWDASFGDPLNPEIDTLLEKLTFP